MAPLWVTPGLYEVLHTSFVNLNIYSCTAQRAKLDLTRAPRPLCAGRHWNLVVQATYVFLSVVFAFSACTCGFCAHIIRSVSTAW